MDRTNIEKLRNDILYIIKKNDSFSAENALDLFNSPEGRVLICSDKTMEIIYLFLQTTIISSTDTKKHLFEFMSNLSELKSMDLFIRKILYRVYSDYIDNELFEWMKECMNRLGSPYIFIVYSNFSNFVPEKLIIKFSDILVLMDDRKTNLLFLIMAHNMFTENDEIVTKLAEKYLEYGMIEESKDLLSEHINNKGSK